MFEKAPPVEVAEPVPISPSVRFTVFGLIVTDVMTVAWMLAAGEWLDQASPVTAVVTLGGHHIVVLWLAIIGFALLGATALLTDGLTEARREHLPLVVMAALVSVVPLGGVLSALLCVVLATFLVTLLGASLLGRGTLLLGHLGGQFRR